MDMVKEKTDILAINPGSTSTKMGLFRIGIVDSSDVVTRPDGIGTVPTDAAPAQPAAPPLHSGAPASRPASSAPARVGPSSMHFGGAAPAPTADPAAQTAVPAFGAACAPTHGSTCASPAVTGAATSAPSAPSDHSPSPAYAPPLSVVWTRTVDHDPETLAAFATMEAQLPYRQALIESQLDDMGYDRTRLLAVVGRGGQLPDLQSGGYRVTPALAAAMMRPENVQHASNMGAWLAYALAEPLGIPSFIYDSTRGCDLLPVARVSGIADIERYGNCHVLNSRAQAINYARSIGRAYEDLRLIVCHMGGGITVSAHEGGRIIDDDSYDEGPMSPERTGGVQLTSWTKLCFSGRYTEDELQKLICGRGGLYSYLGVTDCRQVEAMIEAGDEHARLIYEAMAYQIAKSIAAMTVPLRGRVDAIILTGGAAHSAMLVDMIKGYSGHLGTIIVMPGEDELFALAAGALRILRGEESPHT